VVGLTVLTGHSSPDRSSPPVSTSREAGASSQNEVLPGWTQRCIRRSYRATVAWPELPQLPGRKVPSVT
jgi:hypothetical protein